ncbi:MAG: 2-hydroxyacid dehydrogenase [Anaerolineae bacterium]
MPLRVHMLHQPDEDALSALRGALKADVRLSFGREVAGDADYDVLVGGRPEHAHLTASANLHTFIVPWAGIPPETRALLLEHPHLAVHNLHFPAIPVAEATAALLLAAARLVVPADRSLRRGDWTVPYNGGQGVLLYGKTALILGYGAIGRHVARICQGLGMRVIATRRRITQPTREGDVEIHPAGALPDLLPRATALIVCLPLTPETEGLIGARELARLPAGAILVNVGRGPIVDEAALYAVLKDGRLFAAALDVWYQYPPDEAARTHTYPSAYPFHELENVVMSAHRTNAVGEIEHFRMEELAQVLDAIAEGREAPNRVDVSAGY